MYNTNRIGPRTKPCGTPYLTIVFFEVSLGKNIVNVFANLINIDIIKKKT